MQAKRYFCLIFFKKKYKKDKQNKQPRVYHPLQMTIISKLVICK